jgi:protein ImuA
MDGIIMGQHANIIADLQRDILLLSGFKPVVTGSCNNGGLAVMKEAFPNNSFPLAAVHEFFCTNDETASASAAFVSAILSSLMCNGGATVWISEKPLIFPPALRQFGVDPAKVIFIHPKKQKDLLFVTEEALKCESITAVVSDIKEISFTESRRFQLGVEQSNATGFLIRTNPKNLSTSSVTRWKIKSIATEENDLPGLLFPRWNVELLKVRNGKPGSWQLEWNGGKFRVIKKTEELVIQPLRKIV